MSEKISYEVKKVSFSKEDLMATVRVIINGEDEQEYKLTGTGSDIMESLEDRIRTTVRFQRKREANLKLLTDAVGKELTV